MRELPGEQASIDLSSLAEVANRLKTNLEEGVALARSVEPASVTAALRGALRPSWSREVVQVPVLHRPKPLRVLTLQPAAPGNGRLVLVQGADHFRLRSFQGQPSPAQVGPVILGWINQQLEVDGVVTFSAGSWGDEQGSLVDVSERL